MYVEYNLYMPFWSRVKLLLGFGLHVRAEGERIENVAVHVVGEETNLQTIVSWKGDQ